MAVAPVFRTGDVVIRRHPGDGGPWYDLIATSGQPQLRCRNWTSAARVACEYAEFARVNVWTGEADGLSLVAGYHASGRPASRPESWRVAAGVRSGAGRMAPA